MKNFCTLFDSNYLLLGVSLHDSLEKYAGDFHLWILALDDDVFETLVNLNLANVSIISLSEVESDEVLKAKKNRTWQEYCWTLSPILPNYILENFPDLDHITYLDSDIYFYSDLQPIYEEIIHGESSIMIIPHRFPDRFKNLEINGIYNVQMIYFKRDNEGLECLIKWREQCLEWCYYRVEPERFGDQKYLDKWPQNYQRVCILQNVGSGVAMWNLEQYRLSKKNTEFYVNDTKLIFYHFHQYKYFNFGFFNSNFKNYNHSSEYLPLYRLYSRTMRTLQNRYNLKVKKIYFKELLQFVVLDPDFHHYSRLIELTVKIPIKFIFFFLKNKRIRSVLKMIFGN